MQGQLSCCAGIVSLFFLVYVTVDSHSLVTWTVEVVRRFLSAVVMSPEANRCPMQFSCVFHPLALVCVRSYLALPQALRYQARRRMCRASLPCFTCTPRTCQIVANGTVCVLTLVCLRWILTRWSRGRLQLLGGFCLRLCCLPRQAGVRCSFRVSSTLLLWCVFEVTRRYPRHSGIRLDVACVLLSFPVEKFLCDTCAIFCVLPSDTRGTQAFRLARVVGIHLRHGSVLEMSPCSSLCMCGSPCEWIVGLIDMYFGTCCPVVPWPGPPAELVVVCVPLFVMDCPYVLRACG